jgi:hypothetical protein
MTRIPSVLKALSISALFLLCSVAAQAQATRTWVSGVGDDANPCSRTAPCKTFAGAISKTAAGGEINVLDPGGFGGVTITKSISIEADGVIAGVLVSGTNAIIVNAGASDRVVLRGLTIEGLNTGLNGIRFIAGLSLSVEDCQINRFAQFAIDFEPNNGAGAPAVLMVKNTSIRNNNATGGGILVKPAGGTVARGLLENVVLERNALGLKVENGGGMTVHNSAAIRNTNDGFWAFGGGLINLDESTTTFNNGFGIKSEGAGSIVKMSRTSILGNTAGGLSALTTGQILTFGNNSNGDGGLPTGNASTPTQQ